ncbi:MAG: BLUF domain-containing protein [Gammaproteobacteria bacterium]|nr:BLUF domain-containing protein [Gammaproteobacteria bacterium]
MTPCRLIYRSIAKKQTLASGPLSKLSNAASNNNRRLGIHGILVLSYNRFLQLLEGPSQFVNELFCKIVKDPRHDQVELLSYESIVQPEFIDWSMYFLELDKIDPSIRSLLSKKYPIKNDKFEFPNESFLMTSLLLDLKHIFNDK